MENTNKSTEETILMVKPPKQENTGVKKIKARRKLNVVGIVGVTVLIIIGIFAFFMMQSFTEGGGKPIVGKRFKNGLNPAIKKEELQKLKQALKTENVEDVEVNLTSATLRITIDTSDDFNEEEIKAKQEESVNIVKEILPFETYFTNSEGVKMYDIELHIFNVLKDSDTHKKSYVIYGKTGSGAEYKETPSTPKNEKVIEDVKKEVDLSDQDEEKDN